MSALGGGHEMQASVTSLHCLSIGICTHRESPCVGPSVVRGCAGCHTDHSSPGQYQERRLLDVGRGHAPLSYFPVHTHPLSSQCEALRAGKLSYMPCKACQAPTPTASLSGCSSDTAMSASFWQGCAPCVVQLRGHAATRTLPAHV